MPGWTDPCRGAEAVAWIHEQLERRGMPPAGELDHVHTSPWSAVIRNLRPFSHFGGRRRGLEDACAVATWLGWVCRAVNAHLAGSKPADTRVRLRMCLDAHP